MSGRRRARARTAVDLAVPFSPRMRTPPMAGLTALSSSASRIRSWPTMAVKGYTGPRGLDISSSLISTSGGSRGPLVEGLLDAGDDAALVEVEEPQVAPAHVLGEVAAGVEGVAAVGGAADLGQ